MKKDWVNPYCQNSEPMKRTVSISAKVCAIAEYFRPTATVAQVLGYPTAIGKICFFVCAKGENFGLWSDTAFFS